MEQPRDKNEHKQNSQLGQHKGDIQNDPAMER